jgi:hypothetical protein
MSLKFYVKSNLYKNSNGSNQVNLEKMEAHSYHWWQYLMKFKGKVIFNNYHYSNSTSKHQINCKSLLDQNNININYFVEASQGLNNPSRSIETLEIRIATLQAEIKKPRSHKKLMKQEDGTLSVIKIK